MSVLRQSLQLTEPRRLAVYAVNGHSHDRRASLKSAKSAMRSHPSTIGRAGSLNSNFALRTVPSNETPHVALASETIRTLGGLNLPGELAVKRILKRVTYVIAALYFLADAAFVAIAKPISD